jgi:hypothetical protein
MDTTYGTYGGEQWHIQGFHRETDHLENLITDGRITLKQISEMYNSGEGHRLIWLKTGTSGKPL